MKRAMMMTRVIRLKMKRKVRQSQMSKVVLLRPMRSKNSFLREENNASFWPHRGFVI
jgi:hypothetical protein